MTVRHTDTSLMPGFSFIDRRPANAWHASMLGVSGLGVDYDRNRNLSNPILTPPAPTGFGFGRVRSNYILVTVLVEVSRISPSDSLPGSPSCLRSPCCR